MCYFWLIYWIHVLIELSCIYVSIFEGLNLNNLAWKLNCKWFLILISVQISVHVSHLTITENFRQQTSHKHIKINVRLSHPCEEKKTLEASVIFILASIGSFCIVISDKSKLMLKTEVRHKVTKYGSLSTVFFFFFPVHIFYLQGFSDVLTSLA